jgi:Uncharacterised protein family UPF0640
MQLQHRGLKKWLDKWPGKKTLGIYRFLPLFFGLGAALEFSMINWTVGETNFCESPSLNSKITHSLTTGFQIEHSRSAKLSSWLKRFCDKSSSSQFDQYASWSFFKHVRQVFDRSLYHHDGWISKRPLLLQAIGRS